MSRLEARLNAEKLCHKLFHVLTENPELHGHANIPTAESLFTEDDELDLVEKRVLMKEIKTGRIRWVVVAVTYGKEEISPIVSYQQYEA